MKTFLNKLLIILLFTLILILLFKNNNVVNLTTIKAIELWKNKLFPSLFIMFVINDFLINSNTLNYFTNLFNIRNNYIIVLILSVFSSTPGSSLIIKELYNKKDLSLTSSNKLLMCTYFSNPLFLYTILSSIFTSDLVLIIIISHYLSNIVIFITLVYNKSIYLSSNNYQSNLSNVLLNSIKKAINNMLSILGIVTFFMIISNIFISTFIPNENIGIILKGIFEITQSLSEFNLLNISECNKAILSLSITSFGGLSIHMQVYNIIKDTPIKYKYFFTGRLYQVLYSLLIFLLIYYIR